jgi:hypothetical protein
MRSDFRTPFTVIVLAAGLTGCAYHVADLSLLSTKQVPARPYVLARGVSAEECTHQVFFVPLGSPRPDLGRLVEHLLTQTQKANVLTEVSVDERRIVTGVWNRHCLRVRGTVAQLD